MSMRLHLSFLGNFHFRSPALPPPSVPPPGPGEPRQPGEGSPEKIHLNIFPSPGCSAEPGGGVRGGGIPRILSYSILFSVLYFFPLLASAHPVVSEVMWMGTDLSTADEWMEIMNPGAEDIDLSGWSITSLNSSAKEIVAVRFATGTVLHAGEYLVIASKSAGSSRLLAEPFAVSPTLTLPNTKLLLRLRSSEGTVIDEVDDGVGAPFAGDNPSGTGAKASMERIDPANAGNIKENWQTSTLSLGFDPDTSAFGTPGFASVPISPASPPQPSPPSPSPDPTPCIDPLEIAIAVQSGPLVAVGKATVNFQAVATAGTLSGVACSWSYGDGFVSTSCNPPVHSFITPGTYTVRLEAINQCGNTLIQEQIVIVQPEQGSLLSSSIRSVWYDGSRLIITGALPNPVGADTGKEWFEIKNLEDRPVDLYGWKIAVGETSVQSYLLKDVVSPRETLRIYNSELKFTLPNSASRLQLLAPSGVPLSTVHWKLSDEGRVYLPDDIRSLAVRGRVLAVTGPSTFTLQLESDAASVLGDDTVNVSILGITENAERTGAYEYLRALIENKNIELQFDTEVWDDLGNLLAYVYIEGGILAETQMIVSRLWSPDESMQYSKRKQFEDLESSFSTSDVQSSDSKVSSDVILPKLIMSEVYPAPFSFTSEGKETDWKNEEWLEIHNISDHTVDLTKWKLQTNRSKKS